MYKRYYYNIYSLGGSIAYYLYIYYMLRGIQKIGDYYTRFPDLKQCCCSTILITKSGKESIVIFDNYVHWFKYGRDGITFIFGKVVASKKFYIVSKLFSSYGIHITEEDYNIVKTVNYGYYSPGQKYYLIDGEKKECQIDFYEYDISVINEYMDFYKNQ